MRVLLQAISRVLNSSIVVLPVNDDKQYLMLLFPHGSVARLLFPPYILFLSTIAALSFFRSF